MLCMLGNFSCFCCCLLSFSKSTFSKNSFRNTLTVSNGLDPDQDQHSVEHDLEPNCLQKLSAEDKVASSMVRVKITLLSHLSMSLYRKACLIAS